MSNTTITLLNNPVELLDFEAERKAIDKFEREVGFLNSKSLKANYYRVSQFISDEEVQETIKKVLPIEIAKGTSTILSLTAGGAITGSGVGGLIAGPLGIPSGAAIGGLIGLGIGVYLTAEIAECDLGDHFDKWKRQANREQLITELKRVFKEDPCLEDCTCPISMEIYTSPMMVIPCGHSADHSILLAGIKKAGNTPYCCPTCREPVKEIQPDVVKMLHMKKVFSQLSEATSTNEKYAPEIREAFKALSLDLDKQIRNHFTKCVASLALLLQENKISIQTWRRKQVEIEEKFAEYLEKD